MKEQRPAAARFSELEDGGMKQVSVGGTDVLLVRLGDKCHAVGAHCTHYGAPLVDGALSGVRIVCPWHHACFNARNGHLEEPPALDSLASFDVTIENDEVFVQVPENPTDRETPPMAKRDAKDNRVFVILGGGAAGYTTAQTLREDGFTGRILMITRENRLPYDRPNLSKDYLQGNAEPEWMPLRPDDFFEEHDIEILKDKVVTHIGPAAKRITFENGGTLSYDSLLIATGGIPRKLPFQSESQKNVFLLRSFYDTDAIIATAEAGTKAVVIGASFIGMEAAASLKTRGCDVTVIAPDKVPFEKILGPEIGRMLQGVHKKNGVKFRLGEQVTDFEGDPKVSVVKLDSGEDLEADLVVVGIGVKPATAILDGIELHQDGGVIADKYLSIAPEIYAAGDIVHFPDARTGELTRIEHWRTAMQLGRTSAHNMAGKPTPFSGVPFFWTRQFDVALQYVGHAADWDRIIFDGDVEAQDFLAFYIKGDRILAVAGMNRDREIALWEEKFKLNRLPSAAQLKNGGSVPARATGRTPEIFAGMIL